MSDLFPIEETLSPRLKWMRQNRIEVIDSGIDHESGDQCEITGNQLYRWWATIPGSTSSSHDAGGHTEDEAIVALAKKLSLPLWNEPTRPL